LFLWTNMVNYHGSMDKFKDTVAICIYKTV